MENTNQITFAKFLEILKKNLLWIILAAVIAGSVAAVCAQFLMKDKYSCRMDCVVSDMNAKSGTELTNLQKYINLAVTRMRTTTTFERVVENAGISIGGELAVNSMRSATTINPNADENGFSIVVTTTKPDVSLAMIQSFNDLMPNLIEDYKLIEFDVIEYSKEAPTAASNRYRALKYGAVGAVAGAAIIYIVFVVYSLLDVTIRSESDLKKYVNFPVLGTIPLYSGEVENGEKIINKSQQDKKSAEQPKKS